MMIDDSKIKSRSTYQVQLAVWPTEEEIQTQFKLGWREI